MKHIENGAILAAGEGIRMRPLSNYFPKIALPILNKPLLFHHLDIMKIVGAKKIFLIINENSYSIIQKLLNSNRDEYHFDYELVIQNMLGGTGHALMLLEQYLKNKKFMLLLGDEYYNDKESFRSFIRENNNNYKIGIVEYNNINQIRAGCNVHLLGDSILRLVEKPSIEEIKGKWCWDGSAVLDGQIFIALQKLVQVKKDLEGKDCICLVNAMQYLLENNRIEAIKKTCKNINITDETDFIVANLIEFRKKYGIESTQDILKWGYE